MFGPVYGMGSKKSCNKHRQANIAWQTSVPSTKQLEKETRHKSWRCGYLNLLFGFAIWKCWRQLLESSYENKINPRHTTTGWHLGQCHNNSHGQTKLDSRWKFCTHLLAIYSLYAQVNGCGRDRMHFPGCTP